MSKKLFLLKRSSLFFLSIFIFGMLIAFKAPIFHFILVKYVAYKIPLEGEWDFNYSYLSFQEKGIAFHDVSLCSKEKSIQCKAQKILCKAPSIENVTLSNHFVIDDLEIDFHQQMHSKKNVISSKIASILHFLHQVEIKNGAISIPGNKIFFALKESISPQKLGDILFFKEGQGQVNLELSSWANNFLIDLEAKQTSVAFYKEFIDFFTANKISDWNIEKGKVDGRCFLSISSHMEVKDARMHMNILDGKFKNDSLGILSSFDRIFLDLSYPVSLGSKSFLENVKISSSLDKGEITVVNEANENRFCFKDLSGYFTINAFKQAAMEIFGFVDDKGRLLPVRLVGKPALKNQEGLEIDLSLELEPVFGNSANINVICSHENGSFLVSSSLDSLEVRQMLILQESLSLIYPDLRNYSIDKGSYSGDFILKVNQSGIEEFSLRNLSFENVGIYSKSKDINLDALKINGEIEIDLFDKKKTAFKSWKLDLKDGNITIGREGELPYYFENTDMFVLSREGKFYNSYLKGEISGAKAKVVIDGTYEKPVFDLLVQAKGQDVLAFFTDSSKEYENDLVLSSKIEVVDNIFSGSSFFTIEKGGLKNKIDFDWKGSSWNDLQVNFSSKDFSGDFFPFFNEITLYNWALFGDYSFNGSYTKDKLSFYLETKNCSYQQENFCMQQAKGGAQFEFSNDSWKIDIYLTDGRKNIFDGVDILVDKAHLKISSEDIYLTIRDFQGRFKIDTLSNPHYLHIDQCDLYRNGEKEFDISVHNDYLELCKLSGFYKDKKIDLKEVSHLFDRKILVEECNVDSMDIALGYLLDLENISLPKILTDRKFGEFDCKFNLLGTRYSASFLNKRLNILLTGEKECFTLNVNDSEFIGKVEEGKLSIKGGSLDFEDKSFSLESLIIDRGGFALAGDFAQKDFTFKGEVYRNFLDPPFYRGKGKIVYHTEYNGALTINSLNDFTFSWDKKLVVKDGLFCLLDNKNEALDCYIKSIVFHDNGGKISLHGVEGTVTKKALKTRFGIDILEEELSFSLDADFLQKENDFWISGNFGKSNYHFLDKVGQVSAGHFRGNKKAFIFDLKVPLYEESIDVCAHLFFDKGIIFNIDGTLNGKNILKVDGFSSDGNIDFFRLKGDIQGAKFDLTPVRDSQKNVFLSSFSLDFEKMRKFLPLDLSEFIDKAELKKGIEVIGKLDLEGEVDFSGIVKGTDFDFSGYCLSSLFGKIKYLQGICKVEDFSLVDRSFRAECKEASFDTREGNCLFSAKKFQIENFRPCLLSKKGQRKKVTNPLVLDNIEFLDVKGDLSDLNTLKGKGNIHFVNSFDKQKNIVSSFAKEIIGRIGLDPVLMIPVTGEVDFSLEDGKIHFLKMQNTFSDNKRSHFYLWDKENSFLDFDGNLHINIGMKQNVLFKFAELFIICLDGKISSPKVYLK